MSVLNTTADAADVYDLRQGETIAVEGVRDRFTVAGPATGPNGAVIGTVLLSESLDVVELRGVSTATSERMELWRWESEAGEFDRTEIFDFDVTGRDKAKIEEWRQQKAGGDAP